METTKDLVKFVLESWLGQDEDIVKNYVILLGKALEADEAEFAPLETSPTEATIANAPSYSDDFNQWGPENYKKVRAKKLVKSNKSNYFFVKLYFWQF